MRRNVSRATLPMGFAEMGLIGIVNLALRRSGSAGDPRKDRGFWWTCYCDVCCRLRVAAKEGLF